MNYTTYLIRKLTSISLFSSIGIWILYVYFKLYEFIEATVLLRYIKVQNISFILYSILLVLLPAATIYSPTRSRKKLFKRICFCLSAVILIGAIGDLVTYKFFINYTFFKGDAIFCNIVLGIPNIYGTICCLLLSLAYFLLGIYITENRFVSFILYLFIFLIGAIPPFVYSLNTWGGYPRQVWLEKAAFIIPHQACLLFALFMTLISSLLWKNYNQE